MVPKLFKPLKSYCNSGLVVQVNDSLCLLVRHVKSSASLFLMKKKNKRKLRVAFENVSFSAKVPMFWVQCV